MRWNLFILLLVVPVLMTAQSSMLYRAEDGMEMVVTPVQGGIYISNAGQPPIPLKLDMNHTNSTSYTYVNDGGFVMISKDGNLLTLGVYLTNSTKNYYFVRNVENQNNDTSFGGYNSGRSIVSIEQDIKKTERRIRDNERHLKQMQDNMQSMSLWSSYQRMIQEDYSRLESLQRELRQVRGY